MNWYVNSFQEGDISGTDLIGFNSIGAAIQHAREQLLAESNSRMNIEWQVQTNTDFEPDFMYYTSPKSLKIHILREDRAKEHARYSTEFELNKSVRFIEPEILNA